MQSSNDSGDDNYEDMDDHDHDDSDEEWYEDEMDAIDRYMQGDFEEDEEAVTEEQFRAFMETDELGPGEPHFLSDDGDGNFSLGDESAQNRLWDRLFSTNLPPNAAGILLRTTNSLPLMSRLYAMHAHSNDIARALVQIFGNTDDISVKTLACKYMHRLCLINSKYTTIMYKEGLIPLLMSQLAQMEYVDLAEAAMPLIDELSKKDPFGCVGFVKILIASVDFFNLTTQRLVYRILNLIGTNDVLPMMQETILHGTDKIMIEHAIGILAILGYTYLVQERILELAMDKELLPSVKQELMELKDVDPIVVVAIIKNGHLNFAMELLQIKDFVTNTGTIEEELMHQLRYNPSVENKKDLYDILGKMFERNGNWEERASLISALLSHGEQVKDLADKIPQECMLEQGIDVNLKQLSKEQAKSTVEPIKTEWQLVNKILDNDASINNMETKNLLILCHKAIFRYDTFAKLYQMHMNLDNLLSFSHPVRLSARIVDNGNVLFKAMTAVDLLMPAREVTNILLCKWRKERAAPRPTLIMSSYDDTDLIVGNHVDMLSQVIDNYELYFVIDDEKNHGLMREIKINSWQNLTSAALSSFSEPWMHTRRLLELITKYSLEVRPKIDNQVQLYTEIDSNVRMQQKELFAVFDYIKSVYETNVSMDAPLFVNTRLSNKLSMQLKEQMMLAVGTIPHYWHSLIANYPFLFDYDVKEAYLRALFLGTPRALHFIADEGNAGKNCRLLRLHRAKLVVDREDIIEGIKSLGRIPRDAVLEIEYVNEVGTGSGPTTEFYTLASKYFNELDNLLWTTHYTGGKYFRPYASIEHVSLLAYLMERALMEGRVMELNLHDAFLLKLTGANDQRVMQALDPQLYLLLTQRKDQLIGQPYELPGYPDIHFATDQQSSMITVENVDQYCDRVINSLVNNHAFQVFFSKFSFPASQIMRIFAPQQLSTLILPSPFIPSQWTQSVFLDSIKCDHGYTTNSLQIQWLANWISDLGTDTDDKTSKQNEENAGLRSALIRWITGASRLPQGRWSSLDPKLTIVPKGTITSPIATVNNELPSVMTCVNYLKIPRYSNEKELRERMEMAIREGGESFLLS